MSGEKVERPTQMSLVIGNATLGTALFSFLW